MIWSELTPEYLSDLELLHNPERVIMEWNGIVESGRTEASGRLGSVPADHNS